MDCVNHKGVAATAYCQNCGKALCASCVRQTAPGQVLCDSCALGWQAAHRPYQAPQAYPFVAPPPGGPNPALAAVLGVFPGVGAMYNGQFLKGFVHVAIFAVLASLAHHNEPFGIFVCAWVFYQSIEAYNTAKARRDGQPLPDPLGLNEAVQNWFHGGRPPYYGQPGTGPAGVNPAVSGAVNPDPGAAASGAGGHAAPYQGVYQGSQPGSQPGSQQGSYQGSYQAPYSTPFSPPPPPMPPVPPLHWRRREPIAAVVLIVMGVLFLLGQFDIFSVRLVHFGWPLLLICLGAWLIIRRLRDSQGGSQ